MKGVKNFWIWFGIIVLVCLLLLGACFGIMYLKPGTSLLGLKYISVQTKQTFVYSSSSDYSLEEVDSIYIRTDRSNIKFSLGRFNNFMEVIYENNYGGFSRSDGSSTYTDSIVNSGYNRTLNIITEENYTDLVSGESTINVLLPKNYNFSKITAITGTGSINFCSKNDDYAISIGEIALSTGKYGDINMGQTGNVSNLTFNTYIGSVVFSGISEISANKIEFNTASGSFLLDEKEETQLSTTNGFVVSSTGKANVKISKLLSSLRLNAVAGSYSFDSIGDEGEDREVIVNADNINFSAGKIYGYVSFLDRNSYYVKNIISINELISTTDEPSSFIVGEGYLGISKIDTNLSASSTKGNISLNNINPQNSIYVFSESGDIYVKYRRSELSVNTTTTKVLSKTGNVNLENISGVLYLEILSPSENKTLNVSFNALCGNKEDKIISKDRTPVLIWQGNSDDLICSMFAKGRASFVTQSGAPSIFGSEVTSEDFFEYMLNEYPTYSHQYRVGYQKGSLQYASAGKLFVDGSKDIRVVIVI